MTAATATPAEFMAAALILIYAGAILVTYVFVIMLASQAHSGASGKMAEGAEYDRVSREPGLSCLAGILLAATLVGTFHYAMTAETNPKPGTFGSSWRPSPAHSAGRS